MSVPTEKKKKEYTVKREDRDRKFVKNSPQAFFIMKQSKRKREIRDGDVGALQFKIWVKS